MSLRKEDVGDKKLLHLLFLMTLAEFARLFINYIT